MTSHQSIKQGMATAISQSEAVRDFCVENFGRGALVIVDWYGSEGTPGEKESPFVFVASESDDNESGFVDEETFAVTVIVGACDASDEPRKLVDVERTATQNGLVLNGIGKSVEDFRSVVEGVIRGGAFGATVRTITRTEAATSDYPLEWAKIRVEFFEPQSM